MALTSVRSYSIWKLENTVLSGNDFTAGFNLPLEARVCVLEIDTS